MIRHIYIFITVILFFTKKTLAQEDSTQYLQLYLKEFAVYFQPDSCKGKMEIDLLSEGKMFIDLFECKGRMNFKVFNSNKQMTAQGSYINSLDTLKKYSISRSAIDGNKRIKVLSYFQPLPDGVWKYYKHGKKIKSVSFINGLEESSN